MYKTLRLTCQCSLAYFLNIFMDILQVAIMVYWLRYCVLHGHAPASAAALEGPAGEVLPLEEVLLGVLVAQVVVVLLLQAQLVLRPGSRGQLVGMLLDRRPNSH